MNHDNNIPNNLENENSYLVGQQENTQQDQNYNLFTADNKAEQAFTSSSQTFFTAPSDADYGLKNNDLMLGTQKDVDNKNMYKVEHLHSPEVQDQIAKHENNEDVDNDDDSEGFTYDDSKSKKERQEKNTVKENSEEAVDALDEDTDGSGDDLPKNDKETTIEEDIQSVINDAKANSNSEPIKPPNRQSIHFKMHKYKHRRLYHKKPLSSNNISNLKEKKKLFENVEFEINQRLKEQENSRLKKEKERQKGNI